MRAAVLAALLFATAAPAAPAAQARAPAAEHVVGVDRLVALLVPEDAVVALASDLVARRADGETRALQMRYPGLRAHLAESLAPALRKLLARELPGLRGELGTILAAELTPPEVAETADFLASPAGRKLHAGALKAIAERPEGGDAATGEALLAEALKGVALRDYPAVMRFMASSSARKLGGIQPRVAAASRGWTERLVTENGTRIERLTRRASRKFVKAAERRRSA